MNKYKSSYRSRNGNLVRITEAYDAGRLNRLGFTLVFNPGSTEQSEKIVDHYTLDNLIANGDLK